MKEKDIIKALEICGTYKGKCTDCPAFVKVDRSNCKNVLLGAVEIINRQNADLIDKDKQLQDALKSTAVNKTKVIDCEKEINRLQAENERLRNHIQEGIDLAKQLPEMIAIVKAEAYKEFAERLKEYLGTHYDLSGDKKTHMIVDVDDIDNLLKELVGEDNASTNK